MLKNDPLRFSNLIGGLVLLVLQAAVAGQEVEGGITLGRSLAEAERETLESTIVESMPAVFIGRVVGPDGAPTEGAVVVSSAGGQAVTDARGTYRLEVQVPLDAHSVQVTAVAGAGGVNLVASTQVGIMRRGTTPSGILVLQQGACCQPRWVPTFGEQPGLGLQEEYDDPAEVYAVSVFDDGNGPALHVGGTFITSGGVVAARIAKWDGSKWTGLGSGVDDSVQAIAVFDDGSGAALYVGGYFRTAGGVAANRIAKWDGSSWSALGSGMGSAVLALTVFDDGSGAALYAGGLFTTAGGMAANRIARWDGSSWSTLGSGMNNGGGISTVEALTVFDDGSGPALYAGGVFTAAGGVATNNITKWDGSTWSALGSGVSCAGPPFGCGVHALTAYDDGNGPALYVGGGISSAGGVPVDWIAKWDGSNWSALGSGVEDSVVALTVFDDGSGPALYAGGGFFSSDRIAKWDGSTWSALAFGLTAQSVSALTVFDDGSGPALFAGGVFTAAGGAAAKSIAKWDGSSWSALGSGMNDSVSSVTVFDDGSGPALCAGGDFTTAGGVAVNYIAKWDGTNWSALGSGMGGSIPFPSVSDLTVFDDGGGPALIAGGFFTVAGGVAANRIASWNGTSWSPLGSGMNNVVRALTVFDDSSGTALYAAGNFTIAGGVSAQFIAMWDGSSWSPLGTGMNNVVRALTVLDDGSGPALYAGGDFTTAGGGAANRVARWDGSSWSALGSGLSGGSAIAYALTAFDDGSGPALFAGGAFTAAGGVAANRIAKWDGASWSALGSGVSNVLYALTAFDGGSGPALYAGGGFLTAGGVAANRIAKWDGSSWSALGSGMSSGSGVASFVSALTVFDDGSGPALFAGGEFTSALDSHDSYIAKWGCDDTTPPTISCPSGVVVRDDRTGAPGEIVNFQVTASDLCASEPSVVCVPPSGSFFPRGTTMVTCTATDASGNQSTRTFPVSVALPPRVR